MNKKTINSYLYLYFLHTQILLFFIFFIYIFGLGPAQPTWAGLDPANPARSLAQASELAGQKN